MDKKVFFNQNGVTVSKTRFIVRGQLYEIKNISSMSYVEVPPTHRLSILSFLTGALLVLDEGDLFAVGGCLILVGIILFFAAKPTYVLSVRMPDGEKEALISSDKEHVERVIQAINASIGSTKRLEEIEMMKTELIKEHALRNEVAAENPKLISRLVE